MTIVLMILAFILGYMYRAKQVVIHEWIRGFITPSKPKDDQE